MPEALLKLSPHRNLYLRGFDGRGAAATITQASATGFKASGVFRAQDDFAVVVLHDADDFFGHPRLKYLPDTNLSGMVLSFDLEYTNLQPIDSPKFPTISWPYLEVIREDGSTAQISLFDNATLASGSYTAATGTFTISTPGAVAFDRVTLWYQNIAFDYIAAGGETAAQVATALAALINGATYAGPHSLSAVAVGANVNITASPAGYDGNMIRMYSIAKNANLTATALVTFASGSSAAKWTVSLDFTALGIDSVRQMWLTFAPKMPDSAAYADAEWTAEFTNWAVTGANRPLKVAGPGSIRVEDSAMEATYSGTWNLEAGFYSQGFARRASVVGEKVSLRYYCAFEHDLYIGTSLSTDRGKLGVVVDGDTETLLDCYLNTANAVVTRRRVRTAVPAGLHQVTLTVRAKNGASSANHCYFDFVEAAVPSDVPDAPGPYPTISPASDWDTDHGYKLPPQRLMWMYDKLGFTGPLNEYIGVFWWNQRTVTGRTIPQAQITFGGTYVDGDSIFITIGGTTIGKSVFPADTLTTIAAHFAYFINETFSGVWASASGAVLTITSRAAGAAYNFTLSSSTTSTAGTISTSGSLTGGVQGTWKIDPAATPVLNVAARDWHADLFSEVASRSQEVVSAFSFELVDPPDDPGGGHVWASRFVDGTAVTTATGFGSLVSTHCATGAPEFLDYQKAAFLEMATLQDAAGLTPEIQVGEPLWWFFANASGMGYYDDETAADAATALGRPLETFLTPNDDPSVNAYDDADFLRDRLRDHVDAIQDHVRATFAAAKVEILYPYDVNYPTPVGVNNLGGRLNAYVNTPPEWKTKAGSGFDRIKIEALDFGAGTRSLDLMKQAIQLAMGWGWAVADVRYLYPIFNGGCPHLRERQAAEDAGISYLTPFAIDHVCLFGWDVAKRLKSSVQ